MNLGIDIGSTKTIIYSTSNNGTIVEDEFGKKEIRTVIERTSPIRSFGNAVSGDSANNIRLRRRFFLNNIVGGEDQENLLMFLNYLDRTVRQKNEYKSACLSIPEYFNEQEKRILKSVVEASNLNVTSFMTHLTSIAACACLRDLKIQNKFMIIDCGYSKTSVGIFSFVDNRLLPISRWSIKRGAVDFDNAIFETLVKNYQLPNNDIYREKVFKEINTVKKGLGDLEIVGLKIFSETYDVINMTVNRSEYVENLKNVFDELTAFFEKIKNESKFEGYVEVVGCNSNNAFIKDILNSFSYMTTLNTSDSAALGCCLASAVNSRNMQFRIEEILGSKISFKVEGENGKPTTVFKKNAVVTNDVTKVKYNRKGSFNVVVYENDVKIGVIRVTKKETESPEEIVISVKISPFLTLDVVSAEGGSNVSVSLETFGLSEEIIAKIKSIDEGFSKTENEKKDIDLMRNSLENTLDSFDSTIDRVFPGLLTKEDKSQIDTIRDEFFDSQPVTKSLEEEMELKKHYLTKLQFINDKLKTVEDSIRQEANEIITKFETETSKGLSSKNTYLTTLYGSIYRLKGFLSKLSIGIENVSDYDTNTFKELKENVSKQTEMAMSNEAILNAKSSSACCHGECCHGECHHDCNESKCSDNECKDSCCGAKNCHSSACSDKKCHNSRCNDSKCHSSCNESKCHSSGCNDSNCGAKNCHNSACNDKKCHSNECKDKCNCNTN